eukprot:SAG11_NODE_1602_length_4600_cov_1.859587_4_plen_101_part_00
MLLLYLYARVLARRAFGISPTHEARALFMYLLLSDGARAPQMLLAAAFERASSPFPLYCSALPVFAELAFVNVKFMSAEFCVLLILDFVMLVMRDVRQRV